MKRKCVAGTPNITPTKDADGKFRIAVSGATLSRFTRVTGADDLLPYTYVGALGNVDITPITEMVMGSLLCMSPANAFANFALNALLDEAPTRRPAWIFRRDREWPSTAVLVLGQ